MTTKKIPLSLSRNYVRDWRIEDAIRELIANALDQEDYEIDIAGNTLYINSYGGTIPEDCILLGNGSKVSGDSNIGQFNEGLKIALLVLCRNNISVELRNGCDKWTPSLEYSELYNTECLHITIERDACSDENSVHIEVKGLSDYTLNKVKDNTLALQGEYEYHETTYGTILLDEQHEGKVYIGGLFVDYFKSEYGYNFSPEDFPLDRDRKALKPFDVQWQCKDIFDEYSKHIEDEEEADKLMHSLAEGDKGLEYSNLNYRSDVVVSAADKLYKEKYEGKVVISDFDDYNDHVKAGNNTVYVPNAKLVNVLKQTPSYKEFSIGMKSIEKKDIVTLLDEWLDKWQDEISTEAFNAYEDMVQEIEKLI